MRRALCLVVVMVGCAGPDDQGKTALGAGQWQRAVDICSAQMPSCDSQWCIALAHTSMFVTDDFNAYLLPAFRTAALTTQGQDLSRLLQIDLDMATISSDYDAVLANGCTYSLPHLPLFIGDQQAPLVDADVRGDWTPRSADLAGATIDAVRYMFAVVAGTATVPPADATGVPGLPDLLAKVQSRLADQDTRFFTEPADPAIPRGGWYDRDADGKPSAGDELLVDFFVPGTNQRLLDFSGAELVPAQWLPLGGLPMPATAPRCGYAKWHIDTLSLPAAVGTTDGMSWSPDGTTIVFPMFDANNNYQINIANADGTSPSCLTCGVPAWSDGVRWRPNSNTLLFISNRDHPFAIGGAGGGAGQELYAMRSDGSQVTRLTTSNDWATNYHANWSFDGTRIVWGSTNTYTWDVMVADFVDDAQGMRLENPQRLTHDTTWWETHGFTPDGTRVITTNTRAGLLSPDLYAIEIATGTRIRLTDDPAWDEHGHISPDGTQLSWISGRWRPASVLRIQSGQYSPIYDYWWIVPGIYWAFVNPPSGYSAELTLMNVDGSNLRRLTTDNGVTADNQWSPDGTKILFRQTPTNVANTAVLRVLTFDDCP
jgi:Tol biopolymer transport system component